MNRMIINCAGILSFFAPLYTAFTLFIYIPGYMNFNPTKPLAGDSFIDTIFKSGCFISVLALIAFSVMFGAIVHDKDLSRNQRFKLLFALLLFNVFAMPFVWFIHFRHKFSVQP